MKKNIYKGTTYQRFVRCREICWRFRMESWT